MNRRSAWETPLNRWLSRRLGTNAPPTSRDLDHWRLDRLRETVDLARSGSPYYRDRLADVPPIRTLADLTALPFTTPEDLRADPDAFLAVSHSQVARVVTLSSSGTTGPAKRVWFTDEELESTLDFFHHGMATFVRPGWRVLLLLPGRSPDGVNDLLVRALARLGAEGIIPGFPADLSPREFRAAAWDEMARRNIDALVGLPVQILGLARDPGRSTARHPGRPKAVLLTGDHAALAIGRAIRHIWGAEVFHHYGMTEMGYGGAVGPLVDGPDRASACRMREADLLFEIRGPGNGAPRPYGSFGEVVFTTLTRRAMPLIRYRTGDLGRILPPKPGPAAFPALGRILGRIDNRIRWDYVVFPSLEQVPRRIHNRIRWDQSVLTLADLDETLFSVPGVLDFRARVYSGCTCIFSWSCDCLEIDLAAANRLYSPLNEAVTDIPDVRKMGKRGQLAIMIMDGHMSNLDESVSSFSTKRSLIDHRKEEPSP